MDPFKKKTESQLLDEIFVKDTIKETLNKPKKEVKFTWEGLKNFVPFLETNPFDPLKVKRIRLEQAKKQSDINIFLNQKRKLFFEKITPILTIFIDELGVEVLLNKDTVALASSGSDITKAAILKINEKLRQSF